MRFKVDRASDYKDESEIEISTLEELMQFIEANGEIIIRKSELSNDGYITIYDDYVE